VTVLFDGDAAGVAAPAKAAEALFPAGMSGKVAILPADAGKIDPDDYARAHGKAGVEALLARATPLSAFIIDRAVDRSCGKAPREAPLEQKVAAVRELQPFVRMMPEGLARSVFEDTIAKKLDLDLAALREELSGERPRAAAQPQPPPPPRRPPPRPAGTKARVVLPGPAADALGILAAYPQLGPVAEEENLPGLLPAGPLADLARDLARGAVTAEEGLARLDAFADAVTARRVKEIAGPARPAAEGAERELRKAATRAAIDAVRVEQDRLLALVARKGAPVPEDLAVAAQVAARRRSDLEKRLRTMEGRG
jgi:DNA primase